MPSSTAMSSAVLDFGCSITSPNQNPHSIQNPNPNLPIPFDFTAFSSNTSSDQSQTSNTTTEPEPGFNSNLCSPFASGMSSDKSSFSSLSGRSKPRLVKLRRHSGSVSQQGRPTPVPPQNDSGFNPFRSVAESSVRIREANNSVPNTNSDASETGKFEKVSFVLDAHKNSLLSNLNSEKRPSGANLDFVFGAVPNSKHEQRDLNKNRDFSGVDESGKYNNVECAFGVNNSGLVSNSKTEQYANTSNLCFNTKSVKRDICKGARKLAAYQSWKPDKKLNLNSESEEGEFVFGLKSASSSSSLKSEMIESSENVGRSDGARKEENKAEFGKLDKGGFVFGASYRDSKKKESSESFGSPASSDMRGKMKSDTGVDSGNFNGESTKLSEDMNKVNGDDSENFTGFAKEHNNFGSNVNNHCSVSGDGIYTAGTSGANPVILSDEMKNLKIVDHEKVGDSDLSKDSNVNSCASDNSIFVFGSNNQASGSSTGNSGTTSCHQVKNANSEGHGSATAFEKSGKLKREPDDTNTFVFANGNDAHSSGGGLENIVLNGRKNKNTISTIGATDEQINLSSPSQKENHPINVNGKSSNDTYVGISTPQSFIFQARSAKSFDGPRDQQNDDVKLNKASSKSSLPSSGLAFEAPSTGEVEDENKFSFTSTPNFSKPNLDIPCSFTMNLFPGLNKTSESNAKSRSTRDKGSKKTRAKLKQESRRDPISKEGISEHISESPGFGSPMDFSPYQDDNCASPSQSKDEDFLATREGDDNKYREPAERFSVSHGESSVADFLSEKFVSRAENEYVNTKIEQVSSNSSAGAVDNKAGVSSNLQSEGKQYCFAPSSEDRGIRGFTFSTSSPQDNVSAVKRQNKKKYKIKVGRVPNPSKKLGFASSSAQFSPLSGTSSRLNAAQDKKEEKSDFQSKTENKSKAFEEHVKQGPATVAAQEACEKWRTRGNQAYKNRQLSKAEDFYTKGINCVPHTEVLGSCFEPLVLCYSNRAATRMSLGRMREALHDCLMAAELDPNFLKVQVRAANCHLALGEVEDALQYFRKCLESKSGVCLDRRIMIEAADGIQKAEKVVECTNRCTELLLRRTSNAATSALGLMAEALSLSTYSEKLLEMKGEAFFLLRKYEEVIQLCEETLHFAEKNFPVVGAANNSAAIDVSNLKNSFVRLWRCHLMSKSYFHLGRLEVALDILEKEELGRSGSYKDGSMPQGSSTLLAANIRELLHRKNVGNEAFQSGKHAEAVDHYTAAISSSFESRPFAAICFCNRAAAHQALEQIADAIADCSLAIALDGKYPKAVSRRATLHEKIRDYEQSASDLQRLICVLEKQSQDKVQHSGTPDGATGSSLKELRQARRRLSLMEEKAKKETSLDLYLILGVKASDSASEIKKAYRKAALRHHPDKAGQFLARSESGDDGQLWKEIVEEVHKDADRLFKTIGEAYAVLSDPTKRSEYDLQEELRKARKENRGSGTSGRPSDYDSSPFDSSGNTRYRQGSWKTYGSSTHYQW